MYTIDIMMINTEIYIFTNGLKDGDLHLKNFDNQIGLKILSIDI